VTEAGQPERVIAGWKPVCVDPEQRPHFIAARERFAAQCAALENRFAPRRTVVDIRNELVSLIDDDDDDLP
jgi:hypothetical protein